MNPHNSSFLKVFNFNTGDVSQVFYSTLYTSKSTQEEDSEKQLQIGHAVIKRIKRLLVLDENSSSTIQSDNINHKNKFMGTTSKDECNQARLVPSFHVGLSRVVSRFNAAMTRNVISPTMACLIPSNGGSSFVFLDDFSDLLVGHHHRTLNG
jgi:hypothetical protein